jgi:glycosyltransferase involved in cell wall biosynthesis
MKKVAFLINSMGGGGGEKVVQSLLRKLVGDPELEITLIVLEENLLLKPPEAVNTVCLFQSRGSRLLKTLGIVAGAFRLRRLVAKNGFCVVLSFLERSNFVNVVATLLGGTHCAIVSEHTNPARNYSGRSWGHTIMRGLIRVLYRRAHKVVAVSDGVAKALVDSFGIPASKICTIYNPIDVEEIRKLACADTEHPWFSEHIPILVTVGRLTEPKGHLQLLEAFALVRRQVPSKLVVVGDGELRRTLERRAEQLGVANDVSFTGWKENPYPYIARSSVFVFPSLWEGLGMALAEALACGVPLVSYDCDSGPREILGDGRYGTLVPVGDVRLLADAILKALDEPQPDERRTWPPAEWVRKFDVSGVTAQYRELVLVAAGGDCAGTP